MDKATNEAKKNATTKHVAITSYPVKQNKPLTTLVNGLHQERETGLEPATSSLGSYNAPVTSIDNKRLTSTPFPACTSACTSEAENANAGTLEADQGNTGEGIGAPSGLGDPLAAIAAAIAGLSPADRQRLAAMLTGNQDEKRRESPKATGPFRG